MSNVEVADSEKHVIGTPFQPGHKLARGRPSGAQNKTTKLLKDLVMQAAEQVGEDGAGKDGLLGYLKNLAVKKPELFVPLLAKILPIQLNVKAQAAVVVISPDMTMEQAERAYSETLRVAYDPDSSQLELKANEEETLEEKSEEIG